MSDFLSQFITALVNGGITPKNIAEIRETKNFRRLAAQSDKGAKRSISYWLRIDYDFAFGYARDFKSGIEVRYSSYNKDPNLFRNDIIRIKKLQKLRQAEEDLRIAERHAKIATRAAQIWARSTPDTQTPYTQAKNIDPLSSRTLGATLIVPMYDTIGGEIMNWQAIQPDGTKRFPPGGKKKGAWHIIGQIDPTKPLIICEGFATGASIHMGLDGHPVIVAFDKDNMLHVAKAMRAHYTATPIIVAADNDASGAGQQAAEKIRKTVSNVTVITSPQSGTDFNDIPHDKIKELMAQAIFPPSGVISPLVTDVQLAGGNWEADLMRDAKNRIVPFSLKNAILMLNYHEEFKGVFAFDKFRQQVMICRRPPYDTELDFQPRTLTDNDLTMVSAKLEDYGLLTSFDKAKRAIEAVARDNAFNSAQEYFKKLEWDGVCRLETMLFDYFGCTQEDPRYLSFVGMKWMTAAIKRIMRPGCKFDHVLILESDKQGLYKSAALKALATFGGETYYTDSVSISEIKNPHTILKMQGVMIVELAELSGFSDTADEQAKNWITQQEDVIKLVYDKFVTKYPRQFVFAATTNKTSDYLKDSTGNRRYWPVTVERIVDIDALESDRDQIWAEAFWNFEQGLYIGPTPEEDALADAERKKRLHHDPLEDQVLKIVEGCKGVKSSEVMDRMNLHTRDKNAYLDKRIKTILSMNGFKNKSVWNKETGRTERMWVR
jgi:putative DNA primase/helicase